MKHHGPIRVAYLVSRFPKLTETFVLYEILEVERQGIATELYPLLREPASTVHPEARTLVERAHFSPFLSGAILRANWRWFVRTPRRYLRLWFEVLYHTLGSLNFFVGALGILPKTAALAEDMQRRGVTHVHAHFANHPALAALIVHRLTGIPYSFTAHGSDLHVERRMLDRKLASAAFAVTVSTYNKELMVRECGERFRDRIRVVRCGVDPDQFTPRAAGETKRPFRILCVGSLSEVKGQLHLLRACELLDRAGLEFTCDLVGEGPLRRTLARRIRRAGLTRRVRLLGGRPRPDVIRLLGKADVFVLSSFPTRGGKREGIPVVLMEAMAAGLPVVASDLSGIPELVEHGVSGFLVRPGDHRGLARCLRRLCRKPGSRREMGRAGRRRVTRDFDIRKNVSTLARLLADSAGVEPDPNFAIPTHSPEATHELQTG